MAAMKSPFPGMDPYLERHWPDVHASTVSAARKSLNNQLPEDLIARTEERLAVEADDYEKLHTAAPDVRVFEPGISEPAETGVAIVAPYKLVVDLDPITERFIKIIRPDDERLITVIEFISPTNKRSKGLEKYQDKRSELLEAGVHVVEIDLVRRGDWLTLLQPHACPPEAKTTYRVTVRPAVRRWEAYLYPITIRQPFPRIPTPLREGDPQVDLDLQQLLQEVYETGRYARTLDYTRPPDPPLDPEDAAWADELLRAAGKR
jgi:hypothetical protein